MAGTILVEKDLLTSIRFRRLVRSVRDAAASRRDPAALSHEATVTLCLGALVQLWIYADTHIRDDDTLDLVPDEIDELVGIAGFHQLLPADWLEVLDTDCVKLPDFLAHNGTVARKKAAHSKRQARYRERQKATPDATPVTPVTPARDSMASPSHPNPSHPIPTRTEARAEEGPPPEEILAAYPETPNGSRLAALHNIRTVIANGERSAKELLQDSLRFARFVGAGGRSDPTRVMGPDKFFRPTRPDDPAPWSKPWEPPKSNGVSRESVMAYEQLIANAGGHRDALVQRALDAIGGWQVVRMRTSHDEAQIRKRFCEAYDKPV